jgi:histidinol-phosphate/aromatic aminotransferase/cobyric acid decarboxylase-like protein
VPSSFWSIMQGQGVVVVGTFSKTFAPGLRIGWIIAETRIIEALIDRRLDLGVSPLTARAIADYCRSGLYERHVRDMIPVGIENAIRELQAGIFSRSGAARIVLIHRYFLTLVNSLTNLPPEP